MKDENLPQNKNTMKRIDFKLQILKSGVLLMLIFLSYNMETKAQTYNRKKLKERTLTILKKYDLEGYKIITDYQNAPSKYTINGASIDFGFGGNGTGFLMYIRGSKEEDIIENINTVVHESNHGYTGRMPYSLLAKKPPSNYSFGKSYYAYFINLEEQILVEVTPTFPSKKLVSEIPQKMRTFRFETYISKAPKIQSTQQSGIYGLLGEMNSYYLGTQTSFKLYDYFLKEKKAKGNNWLSYMQDVDATLYACWEFKYYILKYLLYAKKQEPKVYEGIMANQNFKMAFLKIEKNAVNLAQNYFSKRKELIDNLNKKGFKAKIGKEYTFINGSGTGNFMDIYNLLQSELSKKEYGNMMAILRE